jgi:aldehyde:ferredoxin oxidoreductase
MEKLADLRPLALITFGATVAFIFAARHLGLISADRSGPASATVASVIVDPKALMIATTAVNKLADVIADGHEKSKDHVHMICRRIEALADEIEALNRVLGDLRVDLARRN